MSKFCQGVDNNPLMAMKLYQRYLITVFIILGSCRGTNTYVPISPVFLDKIQNLAIFIQMDDHLTLIDSSQTDLTLTIGLAGPLIGSLAREYLESADRTKVQQILADRKMIGREIFSRHFRKDLEASGQFQQIRILKTESEFGQLKSTEAVLTLNVRKWGIKTIEGADGKVKSFMDIQILMRGNGNNSIFWNDRQVISYQTGNDLRSYRNNIDLLREDIHEVIKKSSQIIVKILLR